MPENKPVKLTSNQRLLFITILLSAFTGIVISTIRSKGIDSSALLYIGIPTFIAIAFASTSSSKTVMGSTLKAITFIILISGPLLQEGFVCMIMAAPILYIAGALAAWPFDHYRKKNQRTSKLNTFIIPSLLVLMSMEGVIDETSFNRINTITHTQILQGSIEEIKIKIAASRQLKKPDSLFAKLFPKPEIINANGLSIGDQQWVDISYLKWIYWNEKRGQIQFEVVEHQNNFLRFHPVKDESYLSAYLTWKDTTVHLRAISETQTNVTWSISFQRDIDPAWYAQPLQRYAVGIVAEQMLSSLQ